ncbi:MAG: hypothetical protein QOE17_1623, partial [Gaiellales bacterium]|nr:hypothetical protein [Gaiellales bacterium]
MKGGTRLRARRIYQGGRPCTQRPASIVATTRACE